MPTSPDDRDRRILVLSPTGRDSTIAKALLEKVGLSVEICASMDELCARYQDGLGAALIAEEALVPEAARALALQLAQQPPWSDVPLVVLTSGGATGPSSLRVLESLGSHANVTLLERPVRGVTLQSALHVALRTRRRQYETREYVAERERLLRELERERERLHEADNRKDQFLAMLAHELRNPLAPLTNALRLARFDAHRDRAIDMAERQVRQLGRLLDDLLDVSRITLGKIALRTEPIDLRDVIQFAIEATQPAVDRRNHRLTVVLPREPVFVEADRARLAQVLTNLLGNAIKYTDQRGNLSLTAERAGDAVVVRVRDDGIGIPPELLESVFDLFAQADRSLERAEGGLGIGLTLVRSLVAMHGGSVEAHSAGIGRGAEFIVRLPTVTAPASAQIVEQPAEKVATGHLRVLVVDDNEEAAMSMAELLEISGHEVAVAHHGLAAIEVARTFDPHVILLDIGLPGLDGYEVARRLRQDPATARVLLIALSGYGQEEDRLRSREAGFDHHMVKPADPDAIQEILARRDRERSTQPAHDLH